MKRLTYTAEMEQQDKLWRTEEEDFEIMERLYNQIIAEAKELGFKGRCEMLEWEGEMTCDIYENEHDEESVALVGYCKALIRALEGIINNAA